MTGYREKIKSLEDLKNDCQAIRTSGKKIVFTNGCFDILHPGHTRYLSEAHDLGDYLLVGVNSDRSVHAVKGTGRPILPEEARAELLAALAFVNGVCVFDEDTPLRLIEILTPDILVKGGDWKEENIVGADVVRRAGGKVVRIPFVSGFSTSGILKKILDAGRDR